MSDNGRLVVMNVLSAVTRGWGALRNDLLDIRKVCAIH